MVSIPMGNGHPPDPADWRRFELTEADLVEANRHLFRVRLLNRRNLVVAVLAAVSLLIWNALTDGLKGLLASAAGLTAVALLLPPLLSRALIPLQVRSMMRREPRFAAPWQVGVMADGLHVRNAQGDTRYAWAALTTRHAGPNVLVLTTTGRSYVPLPRRALTAADVTAIEALMPQASQMAGDGLG